ncbi:MAG: nickel/cobalt transporter [Flavobacteriaceae bacterium]
MQKRLIRIALLTLAAALAAAPAFAANPLGVAAPESTMPMAGGILGEFFRWVGYWQGVFRADLVAALKDFRTDPMAGLLIVAGGFAYGVLHAAGPGHGKAVIAAYSLANRIAARRAILLSFASAQVQALTAIVVVGVLSLVLRATAVTMTRYTEWLETGSYVLMTALGLWLVWRALARLRVAEPALAVAGGGHHHHHHGDDHGHDGHHHEHHHEHGEACGCGHSHAVTPEMAAAAGSLSGAWQAILTVGIRPCTGALILLVFSISQGLFWLGAAGTIAMAFGTGLTVATLAVLSLTARDVAVRLAGRESRVGRIAETVISGGAGLLVLFFGVVLLGGRIVGS